MTAIYKIIRVVDRVRRILRRLLGMYTCINCGVVASRGGSTVCTGKDSYGKEILEYMCERCWNRGFMAQEIAEAQKEKL